MIKPVGGRGHKAKYASTHVRIPQPIKLLVESLSDQYRNYIVEGDCLDFENKSLLPNVPAIYFVLENEEVIYVGRTKSLVDRWRSHHITSSLNDSIDNISIAWLQCDNIKLLTALEATLIDSIQPKLNHPTQGRFAQKFNESKKGRTIRLTDEAWDYLEKVASEREVSRTDVIEMCARHKETEQEIMLRAIEEFINQKRSGWGSNNAQKGEFSMSSRTWDMFKQFSKLIEETPWELLSED